MSRPSRLLASLFLLASLAPEAARPAALKLPAVFGDQMVLQRQVEIPVWGTARPGSTVTVELAGASATTTTGDDGRWRLSLAPLSAGGPHQMEVRGDRTIRFSDVLIGEVWLASGQSNMAMPLAGWGRILDFETEIARADYPKIRLFQVERTTAMQPAADVSAEGWVRCSPETVAEFSSTAYFFARRLHRETGMPIGILHSSWGGTVAEAWTSAGTLEGMTDFKHQVLEITARGPAEVEAMRAAYEQALSERLRALDEQDEGLSRGEPVWADPDLDASDWSSMALPGRWEEADLPELDGAVWFRRTVEIPQSWAGQELELSLGPIDDADQTFFNGIPIGDTDGWDLPRRYAVPARLVKAGLNVIAVRVIDTYMGGGLWGEPDDLLLTAPGGEGISLAGEWDYRVGVEFETLPPSPDDPNQPTVLYNGMIQPLAPFALRGVIWYQGESNSSRAEQYRALFPALIRDWRRTWDREDLPFYFVQLAAFEPGPIEKGKWPELREAQLMALSLPATGMAVAVDIGNPVDVHPKNKQEVGNRLARIALARLYGRDLVDSGPIFRSMTREGSRIHLSFDHVDGGLEAKGGALNGFVVAGDDREFHPAEARIEGDDVVVWSDRVETPRAVRYGWADNPTCNLYNAAGLPASPFRTDDWKSPSPEQPSETP